MLSQTLTQCTLILNMCLVGAVQTGPDTYHLDFLDNTGVVVQYKAQPVPNAFDHY